MHFFVDGVTADVMETLGTASGRARNNILGAARMKKLSFVLAAAGLMSLAACSKTETPAENATDNAVEALENAADALDSSADNALDAASNAVDAAANAVDAAANVAGNTANAM
jgi:hypothetical protein